MASYSQTTTTGGMGLYNEYMAGLDKPAGTVVGGGVDPLALQSVMDDLMGFNSKTTELKTASDASLVSVVGAQAEADAYSRAAALAGGNRQTEAISEQVRALQIERTVNKTVGSQKAAVAANGFTQSGSGLDIMRSTYSEGYLSTQISAMQSEQVQRGYLESAAASEGEMNAALARAGGAQSLSDAQLAASNEATANSAALTNAMTQLLAGDPNAQALVTALSTGDTAGALTASTFYNPGGIGAPLGTALHTPTEMPALHTPTSVWSQSGPLVQQPPGSNITVGFKG